MTEPKTEPKSRPPDGDANHKPTVKVTVDGDAKPGPCGCEDPKPGRGTAGLGLLVCGVAGALLYVGLDLVTRGRVSGAFGAGRWEDDGGDDGER